MRVKNDKERKHVHNEVELDSAKDQAVPKKVKFEIGFFRVC